MLSCIAERCDQFYHYHVLNLDAVSAQAQYCNDGVEGTEFWFCRRCTSEGNNAYQEEQDMEDHVSDDEDCETGSEIEKSCEVWMARS